MRPALLLSWSEMSHPAISGQIGLVWGPLSACDMSRTTPCFTRRSCHETKQLFAAQGTDEQVQGVLPQQVPKFDVKNDVNRKALSDLMLPDAPVDLLNVDLRKNKCAIVLGL